MMLLWTGPAAGAPEAGAGEVVAAGACRGGNGDAATVIKTANAKTIFRMRQIITRGPTLQRSKDGAHALRLFPWRKRKTIGRSKIRSAARLEAEHHAGLYAEIALIVVAARERIAEASQHVVGLRRADSKRFIDGNVHAPTDDEIKRIVRGRTDAASAHIANIYVRIGMRAAEHCLCERLDMRDAEFNLGTYVVSEKVAGDGSATGKSPGGAAVALDLGFDPNHVGQEISKRAAATVERKGAESGNVVVLRIEAHVGIVPGNFHFGVILRKGGRCKQQKKPKKCCACDFQVNLLLI